MDLEAKLHIMAKMYHKCISISKQTVTATAT